MSADEELECEAKTLDQGTEGQEQERDDREMGTAAAATIAAPASASSLQHADPETQLQPDEDFDPESVVSEAAFWHVSFYLPDPL